VHNDSITSGQISIKRLRLAMPQGRLLTSPAQLAGYEYDALGYKRFRPALVAIPANAAELVALVRLLKDDAMLFKLRPPQL
jgi:FAD/FMN-containing dehydrogenase